MISSHELNFHHLRYFWMVAKTGSLTAAADRLGLRVQTLSSQIASLEQQLGRALFRPAGRGLALTEAGRVALKYADPIFQLGDQLLDSLKDDELDNVIRISVGIADAIPKVVVSTLLTPLLDDPRLRMEFHEGSFDVLTAELTQHRIDIMLTERPAGQGLASMHQRKLMSAPVRFFARKELADQLSGEFPQRLSGARMLLPSRKNVLRLRLDQWFDSLGLAVKVVGEFDDLAMLEAFGRAGLGVFALPSLPIQSSGEDLHELGSAEGVSEDFYAFVHPRNLENPALKKLISG